MRNLKAIKQMVEASGKNLGAHIKKLGAVTQMVEVPGKYNPLTVP